MMQAFLALLTDPGQSFWKYVLRVTVIMIGGASVLTAVAGMMFPRAATAVWNDWIFRDLDATGIAMTVAVNAGSVTALTIAGVLLMRLATPKPVLVAGSVAAVFGVFAWVTSGPVYGLAAPWVTFVSSIAFQVGRQTSLTHAVAAPLVILAIYDTFALLAWRAV